MYHLTVEEVLAFNRCRRLPYLQRFGPSEAREDPLDMVEQLRHERQQWRERIAQDHPGPNLLGADENARKQALRSQSPFLHQVGLSGAVPGPATLSGQVDLLAWHQDPAWPQGWYLPVEVRTGKRLKLEYELALAAYALILGQAATPLLGYVVLRDGRWHLIALGPRIRQVLELIAAMLATWQEADPPQVFMARSRCSFCAWKPHCRHLTSTAHPLALLPGVSGGRYPLLREAGIASVEDLARADPKLLREMPGLGPKAARELIRQAQSTLEQRPIWLRPISLPSAAVEIYFDIEADPQQDVAYLLGLLVVEPGSARYHACLAKDPEQEWQSWLEFLALVARYPQAPIYHFHAFEVQTCRKLAQRYGTEDRILVELLGRFIDLHVLVLESVVLPVESYSLKNIARWLRFEWRQNQASATQSIVWYSRWVASQDPGFLDACLAYNEDDCRATLHLKRWLAQQASEALQN